jgi:ligand-binding sensor domain-containing protein/signal transduction histidine kinase
MTLPDLTMMPNRLRGTAPFVAVCLAAFLLPRALLGLDPNKSLTQYIHRVWYQEEGLLDPTIYAILQTHDGYLWLGTQNGLVRFDGERFRPVSGGRRSDSQPLLIRSLYEDAAGDLWVASLGSGLGRIRNGTTTWFTTREGLPSNNVTCVIPDRNGGLWVCTSAGLVRFHGRVERTYTTADGLPSNRVHSTCIANDGTQWVGSFDAGLSVRSGEHFIPYQSVPGGPGDGIRAIECGRDGGIWAATDSGLYRIADGKLRRFSKRDGLADDAISSLAQDPNGNLWAGTQYGVSRYRNGEFTTFRTKDGLSHSTVWSLFVDREGSLWVGTKNGLDQFTDSRVTPYTTSEGMPSNEAGPVIEDRKGNLWIGTQANGLARYDGRHFHTITTANGLADDHIQSLAAADNGDLWVGTADGLNEVRDERVIGQFSRRDGLSGSDIRVLYFDSGGALWVGTDQGLDRLEGQRFQAVDLPGGHRAEPIAALGGGKAIRLFLSTLTGQLAYLKTNKLLPFALPEPTRTATCYYADPAHSSLWIGTSGSGLLRLRNGSFTRYHLKDGLLDDQIYAILPDDHQNFWLASSKGIFRVSVRELNEFADGKRPSFTSLPFNTGQLQFECQAGVSPAAWRTRDGRLWFSTTNGLVAVDPNHLYRNTLAPPAQIETVFVNGQRRALTHLGSLAPFEKNLEIRYAGLSFVTPEKVTFRYMLEGYDKSWIEAGNRREAFYTNLPPGHFQFRVMARNSDGVWSSRGSEIALTIEPLLYQRQWFFPALAALVGLLIWFGYQLRVRSLRKQFNLVIAERSRIARELHDTLLQGLSGITMQLQALWTRLPVSAERKTLHGIIDDAGVCLAEARRSLWGLRSPRAEKAGLNHQLTTYAKQALAGTQVKLNLKIDQTLYALPPEVEYHYLRIAQEAITNSLRHAEPNCIDIRLSFEARTMTLSVKDDGKGFMDGVDRAQFGHYGLVGMRERASEIGATLNVASAREFGTEVSVMLVIPKRAHEVSQRERPAEQQPAER